MDQAAVTGHRGSTRAPWSGSAEGAKVSLARRYADRAQSKVTKTCQDALRGSLTARAAQGSPAAGCSRMIAALKSEALLNENVEPVASTGTGRQPLKAWSLVAHECGKASSTAP